MQFFDSLTYMGVPGGKLFIYANETKAALLDVYMDAGFTQQVDNPVQLTNMGTLPYPLFFRTEGFASLISPRDAILKEFTTTSIPTGYNFVKSTGDTMTGLLSINVGNSAERALYANGVIESDGGLKTARDVNVGRDAIVGGDVIVNKDVKAAGGEFSNLFATVLNTPTAVIKEAKIAKIEAAEGTFSEVTTSEVNVTKQIKINENPAAVAATTSDPNDKMPVGSFILAEHTERLSVNQTAYISTQAHMGVTRYTVTSTSSAATTRGIWRVCGSTLIGPDGIHTYWSVLLRRVE
ncbi:MAG: hypothetical protein LBU89_01285 [Fibromonadaceae bacterium]|jgi:hypothetical protein|nr:hypothetical protein [Fibromonadaceae bacterium]